MEVIGSLNREVYNMEEGVNKRRDKKKISMMGNMLMIREGWMAWRVRGKKETDSHTEGEHRDDQSK